jgi:hypothetical protein
MDVFPWGVAIGLGIVLLGTLVAICYILCLDNLEQSHATQKRPQPKDS